jgi:hypothetical protein
MNGWELIKEERERQINEEGWSSAHDDRHVHGELSLAASRYVRVARFMIEYPEDTGVWEILCEVDHSQWPWDLSWYKPSKDPIPNLVKSGALIAAEIDRLQRLNAQNISA